MNLIERRRAEVDAKLSSLAKEFEDWKSITTAKRGLGRHHSQVRRLAATIDGSLDTLRTKLKNLPQDSDTVLAEGESWESEILAAHSIWEVFRSKLVLRQNGLFKPRLAACDDLAWECYSPALERWDPDRKGPPLVYFSATWSPFVVSRDSNFQNEIRATRSTAGALQEKAFQQILTQLPVPLVSVPWYQAFHLPSALIIAHEVGHVLEFDFGLTDYISAALERAKLKHADVWKGWAREMFADVFGCCAMGPAFAGAMIDLNATSKAKVQGEERTYGLYPTRNLRVRLLIETLKQTQHDSAAVLLENTWKGIYDEMTKMVEFRDELPDVVSALIAGPYRDQKLTDIISFPAEWCKVVQVIARTAELQSPKNYTNVRQLFSAAQWLHENQPKAEVRATAFGRLVSQITEQNADRMRGGQTRRDPLNKKKLEDLEAADRKRGAELRQFLVKLAEDPQPEDAPQGPPE